MIPKNASRTEQSEKKSGSPKHNKNLLDAMGTQNIAPPRQKDLTMSSSGPCSVFDKACMCSSLSFFFELYITYMCFDLFCLLSYIHWDLTFAYHLYCSQELIMHLILCSGCEG